MVQRALVELAVAPLAERSVEVTPHLEVAQVEVVVLCWVELAEWRHHKRWDL